MKIFAETIRTAYELLAAIYIEVRSHTFNEKDFWAKIKHPSQSAENVPIKGKTKDLLSPLYERTLDVVYKCM